MIADLQLYYRRNWLTAFTVLLVMVAASTVVRAQSLPAGDYYIVAKHSHKALTAFEYDDGEIYLGQSVRSDEMDDAQVWTVAPAGGKSDANSYTIHSRKYGTALSVGKKNDYGDTSAALSREPAANAPVWRLRKHLNSYGLEAGKSGSALNVTGASLADDAYIIVYEASNSDNGQWLFYPARERTIASDPIWHSSEINHTDRFYRLIALPPAGQEADRMRRMKLMDYQVSGMYVRKGDKVSMTIRGSTESPDGLTVMVGPMNSYEGATDRSEPQLVQMEDGVNTFTASRNGMVYFLYVDSGFNEEALPPIEIEITSGGIPTPLFIAGQTTRDEWRSMISEYASSPYVEMMNDKVLITVTRKVFQNSKLTDPGSILDLLGEIIGWYDEFSGLDSSSPLHAVSPLRMHYLQDLVSSAKTLDGIYMYAADYFVGMPGENVGDLLVLDKLRHAWSIWHETGHKYQQNDWTWSDVVETTVNLYSLEAQAQQGLPSRLKSRDEETGKAPLDMAKHFLDRKARDFTDSKQMRLEPNSDNEYWVRLVMFSQLRQVFGDSFYPALHRYYRENPLGFEEQDDQNAQIQAFVIATSTIAGQDLTRFFADWGVRLTDDTRQALADLDLPPAAAGLSRTGLGK